MLISGIQPFTMLDYLGKDACIVFTPGCNFRCGYCHNPEFVLPEKIIELKGSFIPEDTFFAFLKKRRGLLDGVVVSGGEPTLAPDLLDFIKRIKALGFLVKLDTNGNRPDVIERALAENLLNYIAMDVKTSLADYPKLVGPLVAASNIEKSIALIKNSGIDYEFRTTLIKEIHCDKILDDMANTLRGARRWRLQEFRPATTLNPSFASYHPFSRAELDAVLDKFKNTAVLMAPR